MPRFLQTWLLAAVAALVPIGSAEPALAAEASGPARAAHKLFDEYWSWVLREYPDAAALYFGDDRYPDRLRDQSARAVLARKAAWAAFRDRAARIDAAQLSHEDRVSLRVLRHALAGAATVDASYGTLPFGLYDGHAPVTQMDGFHLTLAELAQTVRFRHVRDYEAWLARLNAVPTSIEGLIERMQIGIESGWMPSKVAVSRVPEQLDVQIVADPKDSPEYAPFKAFPPDVPPAERQRLSAAAERVIADRVVPAFRALKAFYADRYLPAARADGAASRLPGGPAFYEAMLAHNTTTRMTAREIHELGLAEVARIAKSMDEIVGRTGFAGTRAEFQRHISTDDRFFHRSADEMLAGYRDIAKRADAALPALFAQLPRLPYGIRPMRPEQGDNAERYVSGAADESRPGWFEANTNNLKTRPKWEMETLLLHEAVPGHHLQTARAKEIARLPAFRRNAWFIAYGEGWALYAESLGDEMGFYRDPYQKFGNLSNEMWRASRLVVDTGLHAFGWSREQAIDYMVRNTGHTPEAMTAEVDRYLVWPGQATGYKVGELKFKALRAKAKDALGDRFDLRRFHNVLIDNGAVPLDVLEQVVDEWIAAEGRPPQAAKRRPVPVASR